MIRVGDLLWDDNDFVDRNGNNKFTYEEALDIARKYEKRLPTKEEVESLFYLFAYKFTDYGTLEIPSYGLTFKYGKNNQTWISKFGYSQEYVYMYMYENSIHIIPTEDKDKKYSVRLVKDLYKLGEFIPWEEKRCDIACKVLQSLLISEPTEECSWYTVDKSIEYADMLIDRLRGNKAHGI